LFLQRWQRFFSVLYYVCMYVMLLKLRANTIVSIEASLLLLWVCK